ncbi:SCO family protein [Nocardioides sp. ChNu-153]|uniref:SCO family protein n=1 Tax=Nocardioides sp. ChNu-153 TaxID=2779364 RepID=UPI00264B37A7|nr:SCO family protein [Nocardioides sp. ChNu-153]MDN7121296.1 SCO family protein [Nocardioides sp. ChNu-153]
MRESTPARVRRAAAVAALALAGLTACGGTAEPLNPMVGAEISDDALYGSVIDQAPYQVPDVTLTSTLGDAAEGTPYSLTADSTADLTLVFFGYSNCPDICQMVMANVANALDRLEPADQERVQVLFVTTDPARDDVATLRTYLERFDPAFVGLTGDMAALQEAGDGFHVYFEEGARLPSGGYDVTHNDQVSGVDTDDTVPVLWMRDTSPHQLATDVATLLARPAA